RGVAWIQILDPRDPEAAADRRRGPTGRARQQHESRAAVNGEDGLPVVESGDGIHLGAIEQMTPQRRRAGIAHQSGRQDEADAAAAANQLQRALDEELIQVGVRRRLDAVDAGLADEVSQPPRLRLSPRSYVLLAGVAARHLPRRIANDGVEPRPWPRMALVIEEDLRKDQWPVMEPAPLGGGVGVIQKLRTQSLGQRTRPVEQAGRELAKRGPIGRSAIAPEPPSAPQVEKPRPRGQRRILGMQRSQRPLFLADDGRCVVRFQCESQTNLNRALDNSRQAVLWE